MSGELVVDVGAGTGAITLPLARAGAEVWGIEVDPAWAARLEADTAAEDLNVRVIRADLVLHHEVLRPHWTVTT